MGKKDISSHAFERIRERGASVNFVRKVISGKVKRAQMNTSRPDRVILTARDFLGRYWSVICNIQCTEVITVRRAHKKEIKNHASGKKAHKGRV